MNRLLEEKFPHLENVCALVVNFIKAIKQDERFSKHTEEEVFLLMIENFQKFDMENINVERMEQELPTIFAVAWDRYVSQN